MSDKYGKIERANESWLKTFGFDNGNDVIGKTFKIIQGPSTEQETLDALMKACRNGMSFTGSLINYKQDGKQLLNDVQITPFAHILGNCMHSFPIF